MLEREVQRGRDFGLGSAPSNFLDVEGREGVIICEGPDIILCGCMDETLVVASRMSALPVESGEEDVDLPRTATLSCRL